MNRNIILLILSVMLFASGLLAQEETSIAESRKKTIMRLMDYRFEGGFYSFEKLFDQHVTYPEELQKNCVMGIVILSFKVNCKGILTDFAIKNSLDRSLNMELSKFMELTRGHWNKCKDDKYTRFEIPVQFKVKDTETNSEDAVIILEGTSAGFVCSGDDYYLNKIKKLMDKGKGKRADKYIEILIKRDPYNTDYYDLKKKALGLSD